jgi:hypothetical protein
MCILRAKADNTGLKIMLIYSHKHNRIFAKIISIALIHAFFFTGILYQDSINSSDNKNKNIVSIYMIESALRVPMANSKEEKRDFTTTFLQVLPRVLELEEYIFTSPVSFFTACDRKDAKQYEPENMSLVRSSDISPKKKNGMLITFKQWSNFDSDISRKKRRPKSRFGLWEAMPGYKSLSWQELEQLLPAYLIFDKNGRLVGTVDCIQVNVASIDKNAEGLLFPAKGICLNEIVVDPELREKRYPGLEVIYPELEKDVFLLILKEAVNRGLPFNIGMYCSLRQGKEGIEDLLKYYNVNYETKNPDYIEISAAQAKDLYAKIVVVDMVNAGPKIRITRNKRKGRTDI